MLTPAKRKERMADRTIFLLMAAAVGLAACEDPPPPRATQAAASLAEAPALTGNATIIAAAQAISNGLGGCERPADAVSNTQLLDLGDFTLVQLSCSLGASSFTDRLFIVRDGQPPELVTVPDFDGSGWFATDQLAMAEVDAGARVITTYRKDAGHGGCGSEGRYKWTGARFTLEEMRWRSCDAPDVTNGPPYPLVWPVMN
ncbi:DUF1176 domain-containing protein [bacterium]|nr:DUF1176 domain-containing protein [bacterium]